MPHPRLRFDDTTASVPPAAARALQARFDAVRADLEIPDQYPPDAVAEAERAASEGPQGLPDRTDVPFFTLDPPGSRDLDQAMHLAREGDGYRVLYAIADLSWVIEPGGPLDRATRARGVTVYAPDRRTPLHPEVISEGACSLLPGERRPAYVWDLLLDARGDLVETGVARALVRSVERLDYDRVQAAIDDGTDDERLLVLREIGTLRQSLERDRGGASLPLPEQEAHCDAEGVVHLSFRPPRDSEDWNAQISLMTGMAAARIMLEHRIGLLRTMPPADDGSIRRLRARAAALGAPWPADQSYGDFIRSLDRSDPRHLALIMAATSLFRGAGYTSFDGEPPADPGHAAVAAPYAHVTAPLRRLIDRFGLALCAALVAGEEPPSWVRSSLAELPESMMAGDRRARAVERACADAVEAAVLVDRVGEVFDAAVVTTTGRGVEVQLVDEPVLALTKGSARLGEEVRVRLDGADIATGSVDFHLLAGGTPATAGNAADDEGEGEGAGGAAGAP